MRGELPNVPAEILEPPDLSMPAWDLDSHLPIREDFDTRCWCPGCDRWNVMFEGATYCEDCHFRRVELEHWDRVCERREGKK